jgi:RNA ligase (TIGR02306 family)
MARDITPIEGADAIEAVKVDGWVCVAKKGEFQIGDIGIYFEIDSFLPASDSRFEFLNKQFITFDNKLGARLRTIRLRGQLSQGLFLPLSLFPELCNKNIGDDVTEELKIEKWEPPISAQLAGEVFGVFPHVIRKTDQERVQNLLAELHEHHGAEFEVSIKLDGSSMTVFRNDNANNEHGERITRYGVCGRNWDLRDTPSNSLWKVVKKNRLHDALNLLNRNLALQGEIIGEGIQENPEKIHGHEFFVFDIFDIDKQEYLGSKERHEIIDFLQKNDFKINHVPVLDNLILNHSVEDLLALADGTSLNPTQKREGLVFKRLDGKFSFKAISNWYLEKHKNR